MPVRRCAVLLKLLGMTMFAIIMTPFLSGKTAVVDCSGATPGAFTSINAALFTLPLQGPNSITISGTCTESFAITGFHELLLQGVGTATIKPGAPNANIMNIFRSQGISVKGPLVFDGGRIIILQNSVVNFDGVTVQNSFGAGILSSESTVDIANSFIQNNASAGIAMQGGSVTLGGNVITANALGIVARHAHVALNASGTLNPGNTIGSNTGHGIALFDGSQADIQGGDRIDRIRILSNGDGLFVTGTSTVTVQSALILSNKGPAVHISQTSHGEFTNVAMIDNASAGSGEIGAMEVSRNSDVFVTQSLINGSRGDGIFVEDNSVLTSGGSNKMNFNGADGVRLQGMALAHFLGTDTMTGNAKFSLQCDSTSLVEGDVSNLTPVHCSRIALHQVSGN